MLIIEDLHKRFGTLEVLRGIHLKVPDGQVVAILGPSGTGKSTLLRCINFLETPERGRVTLGDVTVDAEHYTDRQVRALRQKTSMVFQNYNLFRNKTCLENVMIPLTITQRIPRAQAREQAARLLAQVGLSDKEDSYPSRLSGGQQQRVGIARAMAARPECILFDEPTSSLDPELVGEVLEVIRRLAQEHNQTILIVTHEMKFAREISQRVLFMDEGAIIADETTHTFFSAQTSPRIRRFLSQLES